MATQMRLLQILILFFPLLSCSKNPSSAESTEESRVQLSYTSRDSSEANDLALWASAQLVPSDSAVDEMLYRINYLRFTFKDSSLLQYVIQGRFMLPWLPTRVVIIFDSATAILVRNGTYSGWSMLPYYLKSDTVTPPDELGISVVYYSQHRNPWRVCDYYSALPGVLYCGPDWIGSTGQGFPVIAGIKNGQMSYIFFDTTRHYFYYQNEKPVYAGIWSMRSGRRPSWWQEAQAVIDSFHYWGKYK